MAHMCGLVIAFCIACEWIGLLLLRLLVIFSQRMGEDENTSHCVLVSYKFTIIRASIPIEINCSSAITKFPKLVLHLTSALPTSFNLHNLHPASQLYFTRAKGRNCTI